MSKRNRNGGQDILYHKKAPLQHTRSDLYIYNAILPVRGNENTIKQAIGLADASVKYTENIDNKR